MCMQASISSIDDQLISDAVDMAEIVIHELDGYDSMNTWEHDLHYKAQMVLSLWRSKCQEMQSNALA